MSLGQLTINNVSGPVANTLSHNISSTVWLSDSAMTLTARGGAAVVKHLVDLVVEILTDNGAEG
jgi:hypothetical protein